MKIKTFTILFYFFIGNLFGQNGFELVINDNYDSEPICIIEHNSNYYLTVINSRLLNDKFSIIYKIDNTGQIIDSLILDSFNVNLAGDLLSYNENILVTLVTQDLNEKFDLNFLLIDDNLNIVENTTISTNYVAYRSKAFKLSDSKILVLANCSEILNYTGFNDLFIELDENLDTLLWYENKLENLQFSYDILKNKDGYYLFTYDRFLPDTVNKNRIFDLNLNYNKIKSVAIPGNLETQYDCEWLYENRILVTGNISTPNEIADYNIGIVILDTLFNKLYSFSYGVDNINEYTGLYGSLALNNTILFAATDNFLISLDYFQNLNNSIIVNILDTSLQLKSQKFYGGNAYYNLYNVLPTNDDGFIVLSNFYDENKAENYRDIYILKVDSLGNYIPASLPEEISENSFNIYPNPGNEFFKIEFSHNNLPVDLNVYDISGKCVSTITVNSLSHKIETGNLNPGMYFIQIKDNINVFKTVKWIKE